ncbi:MAG: hypothetical protein J6K03_06715 [Oscillospiraceae bacterium]|nr:hypothetical protein [Oscillospiraceae bacterium]
MYHLKEDMARIQTLVGKAFTETGGLLAMADGAYKSDAGLQRKLEQTMEHFEKQRWSFERSARNTVPAQDSTGQSLCFLP